MFWLPREETHSGKTQQSLMPHVEFLSLISQFLKRVFDATLLLLFVRQHRKKDKKDMYYFIPRLSIMRRSPDFLDLRPSSAYQHLLTAPSGDD
ncbi:MAG: hypothetical protein KF851_00765 [Pirellulaceae bacterium]|nr:hypothetical protein [Pirellulaceae bacterium]